LKGDIHADFVRMVDRERDSYPPKLTLLLSRGYVATVGVVDVCPTSVISASEATTKERAEFSGGKIYPPHSPL
jgi:hypothetical protein